MIPSPRTVLITSPELWERGHGPAHPLKPERLLRTHSLLAAYSAFDWENVNTAPPRPPTDSELSMFHTHEYISAVRALSEGDTNVPARRFNFGPGDNPVFPGMFSSEGLKVGSTLRAAEMLVENECDVAFSFSGGLHHGGPGFSYGFCVFNDAAVAIHWLLERGARVAYVDIDVHHGDGVQDAFYETDQVLTISLHQDGRTLFPGTGFAHETGSGIGDGFNVNLPLPPLTGDDAYLWAFEQVVAPLIERFSPDVLVTQLGVDTHFQDPLANLALTTHGHAELFAAFASFPGKWLALGGGGYNLDVVPRAWALAFSAMTGHPLPDELPLAYRNTHGGQQLHDQSGPMIPATTRTRVRAAVESVVEQIRRIHKI